MQSTKIKINIYSFSSLLMMAICLLYQAFGAEVAPDKDEARGAPTIQIWVPTGIVGDDYWIYLNGHLLIIPPNRVANWTGKETILESGKDGWEIWSRKGFELKMHNENYDNLINYLNSGSEERLHLFQKVELTVPPGSNTIEMANLTEGSRKNPGTTSSFPFVISRKYVVDVEQGPPARVYIAPPSDWSPAKQFPAVHAVLGRPDIEYLAQLSQHFTDDLPIVLALWKVFIASKGHLDGVVVLELPLAQGGAREFNADQICRIAKRVLEEHSNFPTQKQLEEARKKYPNAASVYIKYEELMKQHNDKFKFLRELAEMKTSAAGH